MARANYRYSWVAQYVPAKSSIPVQTTSAIQMDVPDLFGGGSSSVVSYDITTIWALIVRLFFPVASRDTLLFHCPQIQAW